MVKQRTQRKTRRRTQRKTRQRTQRKTRRRTQRKTRRRTHRKRGGYESEEDKKMREKAQKLMTRIMKEQPKVWSPKPTTEERHSLIGKHRSK